MMRGNKQEKVPAHRINNEVGTKQIQKERKNNFRWNNQIPKYVISRADLCQLIPWKYVRKINKKIKKIKMIRFKSFLLKIFIIRYLMDKPSMKLKQAFTNLTENKPSFREQYIRHILQLSDRLAKGTKGLGPDSNLYPSY